MPNMSIGQLILITNVGEYLGQTTMNTYPHIVTAAAAGVDSEAFFASLDGVFTGGGKLFEQQREWAPQNWESMQHWYQIITPTRFRKVVFAGDGIGMFNAVDSGTANVQAAITRHGELAEKRAIGGVRIPIGSTDDSILSGKCTPALQEQLALLATQMHQTTTTLGVTIKPVVGMPDATHGAEICVGAFHHDQVRVLRRRTLGLGI